MTPPTHTLVYFGHFSPQKKIKLVLSFHLNKNYQAEQCDTVLKSHRPHFWQIATSCNHHSHNVQLTHPQMHGFFLALECSISIKCGGQGTSAKIESTLDTAGRLSALARLSVYT